jgi:cytochrome c peroxidase
MKKSRPYLFGSFLVLASGLVFSSWHVSSGWLGDGSITDYSNDTVEITVPEGWPYPTYDFSKNPLTTNGIELGRALFYDPLLSADSSTSCASCHLQYTNFTHVDHSLSHGIFGRKGTRNTLSIMNLAWSTSFMWDGGVNHIEVQPLAPIESSFELNSSLTEIIAKLKRSSGYADKFKRAFGAGADITGEYILKALAQYMLTLNTYNSKYDKVMRKEEGFAFTEAEQHGYELFKQHCASCHTEPLFTNNGFANNGLAPDPYLNDGGRIKITGRTEDSLKFKVPSLRNIEVSYPYMHDGRFRNLQMVIFHYNDDIHPTINLADQLKKPMNLSESDKNHLLFFLKTLTDTEFLKNPALGFPKY